MHEVELREGVAVRNEPSTATPRYVFVNRRLSPCKHCGDIHEYLSRGCVTVVASGGTPEFEIGQSMGEAQEIDELPARWRPWKRPASNVEREQDESLDMQDAPMREVYDPVMGRDGQPL